MNLFRKFSFPIVGFAVLAVLLTLAAPRAVHALAAALVQVVNTTANPAITQDTSRQASQIVTLLCQTQSVYPTPFACIQIDSHGQDAPTLVYTVPSSSNFILTSLDYFPNGAASGQGYLTILDQTQPSSSYESIGVVDLSKPVSFQFSSGIVVGGTAQPEVACSCGFGPFIYLHGYLTSN